MNENTKPKLKSTKNNIPKARISLPENINRISVSKTSHKEINTIKFAKNNDIVKTQNDNQINIQYLTKTTLTPTQSAGLLPEAANSQIAQNDSPKLNKVVSIKDIKKFQKISY